MLYRVMNRPLEFGTDDVAVIIPVGDLISTTYGLGQKLSEKSIAVLERCGAISRVSSPPLAALPDWRKYANTLSEANITDGEQFLETDSNFLQLVLGVDGPQVQLLKSAMLALMTAPRKQESG